MSGEMCWTNDGYRKAPQPWSADLLLLVPGVVKESPGKSV
jgi:hypothetical protein